MNKKFPEYYKKSSVYCCYCSQKLGQAEEGKKTDYPEGRGKYTLPCEDCGMSMWYDILDK